MVPYKAGLQYGASYRRRTRLSIPNVFMLLQLFSVTNTHREGTPNGLTPPTAAGAPGSGAPVGPSGPTPSSSVNNSLNSLAGSFGATSEKIDQRPVGVLTGPPTSTTSLATTRPFREDVESTAECIVLSSTGGLLVFLICTERWI